MRYGSLCNAALQQHEHPLEERDRLTPTQLSDEFIYPGLRSITEDLDLDRLESDYGVDLLTEKPAALADLERNGFLALRNYHVYPTREGP